ncbi:MAG: M48 family metalloprotease [Candidatus Peribacteria bacterium]|nr:M48 family metalloprotease [Candidatus Peribacteria bacterium]
MVFTSGLLETLNKREIEAVAAHELSHIINKDALLMLIAVVYIGALSAIGKTFLKWSGTADA